MADTVLDKAYVVDTALLFFGDSLHVVQHLLRRKWLPYHKGKK